MFCSTIFHYWDLHKTQSTCAASLVYFITLISIFEIRSQNIWARSGTIGCHYTHSWTSIPTTSLSAYSTNNSHLSNNALTDTNWAFLERFSRCYSKSFLLHFFHLNPQKSNSVWINSAKLCINKDNENFYSISLVSSLMLTRIKDFVNCNVHYCWKQSNIPLFPPIHPGILLPIYIIDTNSYSNSYMYNNYFNVVNIFIYLDQMNGGHIFRTFYGTSRLYAALGQSDSLL